jgi:5-methylcytosine-specific restriction enzyme A
MPQWANSTRRQQLPPNWPQLCAAVRVLFGRACYLCGHPDAVDTDHVIPGDDHSLANLRPACGRGCPHCAAERRTPCHPAKSSAEGGRARAAKRTRPAEPHPGIVR